MYPQNPYSSWSYPPTLGVSILAYLSTIAPEHPCGRNRQDSGEHVKYSSFLPGVTAGERIAKGEEDEADNEVGNPYT